MDELNDPAKTRDVGLTASVMDYVPVNISPKGKKQGDYFSRTIGPYDIWAIEYAYTPLPGGTEGEVPALQKIASKSTKPELDYATDEDAMIGGDPLVNLHDLSKNPIEFARWRIELINQIMPGLVDQMTEKGEGYQVVRMAFGGLLNEHHRAMHYVARFIGGVYGNRDHKGQPDARPPFVVTEAAKQREALELLNQQVFGPEAYQFPTSLYNYLAPSHWDHWGMPPTQRPDIAIHSIVLSMQEHVLAQILSPTTLSRLVDSEMKVPAKQDVFTAAELLKKLTAAVFAEIDKLQSGKFTDREPAISSLRRNLQQHYFQRLSDLALGDVPTPTDCRTVAYAELQSLETRINKALAGKAELDTYTRSHLTDLAARIHKVLDARIELKR